MSADVKLRQAQAVKTIRPTGTIYQNTDPAYAKLIVMESD